MKNEVITLIPTSNILSCPEVLRGYVFTNDIKITVGSGMQGNFNPASLMQELKDAKLVINSFSFNKDDFLFSITIKVTSVYEKINEVGLFWQDKLIAYRSDKEILKFDTQPNAVLELVLPASEWNQNIDITKIPKLPEDIYTVTPENLPTLEGYYKDFNQTLSQPSQTAALENSPKSNFYSDSKLPARLETSQVDFIWNEVAKNDIYFKFEEEVSQIALDRHPQLAILHFLYKKKNGKEFYINSYDLVDKDFHDPLLVMTVKEPTSERYGIFGKIDDKFIRCYQSHPAGVFCMYLSLTEVKSFYKQQYHAAKVKDDTTLFKIGTNAALAGGSYIDYSRRDWNQGGAMCSSGEKYESFVCMVPTETLDPKTVNPLVKHVKGGKIDIVGVKDPDPIKEPEPEKPEPEKPEPEKPEPVVRKRTRIIVEEEEEIVIKKVVSKGSKEEEEIREKKVNTTKEKEKEAFREKQVESKTEQEQKEKELQNGKKAENEETASLETGEINAEKVMAATKVTEKNKIIIIKKANAPGQRIMVKQLPLQVVNVDTQWISTGNYGYFKTLNPKLEAPAPYRFESIADYNDMLKVNALTHMICSIDNLTYIFSRNMFKSKDEAKFFVFDNDTRETKTYFVPDKAREFAAGNGMINYTDAHVLAFDKVIYFTLHIYSNDKNRLITQIIKLEVNS